MSLNEGNQDDNLNTDIGGTNEGSQEGIVPDDTHDDDNVPVTESNNSSLDMNIYSLNEWNTYNTPYLTNYSGKYFFEFNFKYVKDDSYNGDIELFLRNINSYAFDNPETQGNMTEVSGVFKNQSFNEGYKYWDINQLDDNVSHEIITDDEDNILHVIFEDSSEFTIKQLIDVTGIDFISFDVKSNEEVQVLNVNFTEYSGSSDVNQSVDGSSELVIDSKEKDVNNRIFQARVFHEQNNQVYGAEVVIIPENLDYDIETILITDNLKLDAFNSLVENMENCYIPYTPDDLENLNIFKKLAIGEIKESDEEYKNMQWSKLHDKGDLENILKNNISLSNSVESSYVSNDYTIINATHLDGFSSDDFMKSNATFDNYLDKSHALKPASTSAFGHALIVDNLNETKLDGGKVLSANQGRVLNESILDLEGRINSSWSSPKKLNEYITYKVNNLLRLFVCTYKRRNYKGLQTGSGKHILHGSDTIKSPYKPLSNIVTPLVQGNVTLCFDKNGGIFINGLSKQSSIDIEVQVSWHY